MSERQEFFDTWKACKEGQDWVAKKCPGDDIASLYDYLSQSEELRGKEYYCWLWQRAFDDKTLRLMAVRFVRETPIADGRKVVDLLTDQRSLDALDVADRFANGLATNDDLAAARAAAWAAAWDAREVARDAARAATWAAAWATTWDARDAAKEVARDAARAAAWAAAWAAARAAAREAQKRISLSYGNPFVVPHVSASGSRRLLP